MNDAVSRFAAGVCYGPEVLQAAGCSVANVGWVELEKKGTGLEARPTR